MSHQDEKILVLAPKKQDAELVCRYLSEAELLHEICQSMQEFCRKLEIGAGVGLIVDEVLTPKNRKELAKALDREPAWSDLPLIIIPGDQRRFQAGSRMHEMLAQLGTVTLLDHPKRPSTLISAVKTALRERCRQYQCRDLLQQQKRAVERLDLVADIANHLLLTKKPEEVVNSVFAKISAHLGLEIYFNYLFDDQARRLRLIAYGGISKEAAAQVQWLSVGEAVCGMVAQHHKKRLVEEVQACCDPKVEFVRSLGVTAYAAYPLIADGHLIGTLSFGTRQRPKFDREELALMETVSNQVAVAIQRKRTEEALHDLNLALEGRIQERTNQLQESADQMEAFSYSISHDLRAPLRTIRGFSQALLEDYGRQLDGTGKDYLNRLMGGAERMDGLIQDLLEYSRLSRSKITFELVDLGRCVDNVLRQLEGEVFAKKGEIIVHRPLSWVQGHPPTLEQAIVNLLSNALKFTEPGTKPRVSISTEEKAETVRLWIEDNGIGIALEHQQRIFGVFERLHGIETYPGTGIGLAVVIKAITRMGGQVGVESNLGQGSRFWIELPKPASSPRQHSEARSERVSA